MKEKLRIFFDKQIIWFENLKWIPNWLKESNRSAHLIISIYTSLILTLLFSLGLGMGMEFKDEAHGGKWDNLDLLATIIGGVIGQIIQTIIILALVFIL